MPTTNPDSQSNAPAAEPPRPRGKTHSEMGASSIQYVGRREPQVPVPVLLMGLVALAGAIIAFLHYFRG